VDDTHAFLSGSAVFFYVPERRKDSILVNVEAPPNWKVATGLESVGGNPRKLIAADYDVLADSPLEIGIHNLIEFEIDGKLHQIAIWGGVKYDPEKLKADFSKIIKSQAGLFGEMPYRRYLFIIHVGPDARGGTEHLNSTIIQIPRRSLENEEAYKTLLGTVAHEYFHTWNVKQFRPSGIHPYDYTRENYTDLLWLAEGTTSYYASLTLARVGLITPDDYLKVLSDAIHAMRNRPGAQVQSLAESSFDAWVKFNQPTPDDTNSTVSFYSAGSLVSLLMDMELRSRSQNRVSLDTVMREMYRRFPVSGSGYTTADLMSTLERVSGFQWERFFDNYVNGTMEYPFESALTFVGFQLEVEPDKKDEPIGQRPYAGLNLTDQNGGALVRAVIADGPAYTAGIVAGDEIVAVNGQRLSAAQFDELIGSLQVGDTVTAHIIRRDQLRTIPFKLSGKPNGRWKVSRIEDPTDAQKQAYRSWVDNEWPKSSGEK
jgi:predicted metalloprotease with PDZ domain